MTSTDQVSSEDIPVWDKPTIPEDAKIFMLTEEQNYDYGGSLEAAYKLPISRIVASNAIQSTTHTITDKQADITIEDNTVVPAYVETFSPFHLKRAQASSKTTKARFVITGRNQNIDNGYIIQGSGYVVFDGDHDYEIGQTYYLSDSAAGAVTTEVPTNIVQPLFTVIDARTIQLELGD
jgi:hypothetical protein